MANITRPSLVWGTMMALLPGRNERSNTRCTPWLGAIMAATFGIRHAAHGVAERPGRVDHDLGAGVNCFPGLGVMRLYPVDKAISTFRRGR